MDVYGEINGSLSSGAVISGIVSSGQTITGTVSSGGKISGAMTSGSTLAGTLASAGTLIGTITVPSAIVEQAYTGETEVTPTEETQTLSTKGYYLGSDITINPIPSNYGLITWDGSKLTIS